MVPAWVPSPSRCSIDWRKNGTLLAIDTNPDFVDYLRKQFPDPRLIVVLGSAADVEQIVKDNGFDHADFVLSGLPFSTLPPGVGDAIGSATARVTRAGGAFLVYQFSPKVRDFIAPYFERHRARLRMDQRSAGDPVLGMARTGCGLKPFQSEINAPRDGVIHRRDQKVGRCPFRLPP